MNEKEIKEIISYDKKATTLYMPNEIFEDLVACKEFKKDISSHIAFAYSYTYLCTLLYRHCNYFQTEPITQERLKEILGYTAQYKGLDYIIKKNGILEKLGYLETTTDYPISWEMDEDGFLDFETVKEWQRKYDEELPNPASKNFKIKLPLKAFHRTKESENDKYLDGTFYDTSYTHMIPIEAFMYCMSQDEMGVIGFYLYAYITFGSSYFENGFDASLEKIQQDTGIKPTTLDTYMNRLKEHNMIRWKISNYVFDQPQYDRRPNTYWANEYKLYGKRSTPFKIRTVQSLHSYEKENGIDTSTVEKGFSEEFLKLAEEDVDGSMLPF